MKKRKSKAAEKQGCHAHLLVQDIINSKNAMNSSSTGIGWKNDANDSTIRQTRIAMLKMREELHDLTFSDNHHAHDFFVVNSFKLFYSLRLKEGGPSGELITYRGSNLPRELVPLEPNLVDETVKNLREFAVFPKESISYADLKREMTSSDEFKWKNVIDVCNYIASGQEFGITLKDLAVSSKK